MAALDELWPFLDFVLIMTVNPGFGGQHLIAEMFDKIGRIRSVRDQRAPSVELVVDGGVDAGNARELRSLGTDVLVAGTAVFHTTDRRRAIAELRGEEAR